jgi:hypothetical protein
MHKEILNYLNKMCTLQFHKSGLDRNEPQFKKMKLVKRSYVEIVLINSSRKLLDSYCVQAIQILKR